MYVCAYIIVYTYVVVHYQLPILKQDPAKSCTDECHVFDMKHVFDSGVPYSTTLQNHVLSFYCLLFNMARASNGTQTHRANSTTCDGDHNTRKQPRQEQEEQERSHRKCREIFFYLCLGWGQCKGIFSFSRYTSFVYKFINLSYNDVHGAERRGRGAYLRS